MGIGLETLRKLSTYSCLISRIYHKIKMERQLLNPLKTLPSSHILGGGGKTLRNPHCIHMKIKSILSMRNSCYHHPEPLVFLFDTWKTQD